MKRMASFLQKGFCALQKWGYQRARAIPSNKEFLVPPGYRVDMGLLPSLVFWGQGRAVIPPAPKGTCPLATLWSNAEAKLDWVSSKKISAPNALNKGPLGAPAQKITSSMVRPQCRSVVNTRPWDWTPRAVTRPNFNGHSLPS